MKKSLAVWATIVVALCMTAAATGGSAPPGATAHCRDGTFSFSQHHQGTCSHHGGVAQWLDGSGTGAASARPPSSASSTGAPAVGVTIDLAPRTRTAGCTLGPRPDRRCSPGAYYSELTKQVICSAGFRTSTIRNVPQSEKFSVENEYGMQPGHYGSTLEIDHIVSLELGGSNDIANLYPEPGSGAASYHVKDRLENRLHRLVCAGTISLHAAQLGIARNWLTLYKHVFGAAA